MKHIILIRFNINYLTNTDNPDQWLDGRMRIFYRYTLPSLLAQTNQNFEIQLYCSKQTPNSILRQLSMLPKVRIVFYGFEIPEREITLTSRLDSDDIYSIYAVELIQAAAKKCKKETLIDAPGFQFRGRNWYYFDKAKNNSPFVSLLSHRAHALTWPHSRIHREIPNQIRLTRRIYAQHVHRGNIVNSIKASARQASISDVREAGILT